MIIMIMIIMMMMMNKSQETTVFVAPETDFCHENVAIKVMV